MSMTEADLLGDPHRSLAILLIYELSSTDDI